jgi:hypothetical protein
VSSTRATSTGRYARLAILIDRLMPEFDATRIEHPVVAGRASEAYAAAVGVDFVDAVRQSHAPGTRRSRPTLLPAVLEARTLVSYEARTRASDVAARQAFWRYWRVASPFVGRVMRAQLAVVEREAARLTVRSFA